MDKIRHPNIISIMAYAKDFSYCYIIMELCNSHKIRKVVFNKNVASRFALSDLNRYHIAEQICIAVAFLHKLEPQIVHKDLKQENILIDNYLTVTLCDLGTSRFKTMPSSLLTTGGCRPKRTVLYMSPEILLDNKSDTPASDVWALGGVIKELFTKKLISPSAYEDEIENYLKLKQKPDLANVPLYLNDILNRCFNY
ncbi:dual specificity protein kinase shkC-like [Nasonia vitripennis]|uniref:Protein kinase domain-containing protein n=1 Tax=Nasonia vitripennis TaxID=7425 RepID=A0A7M7LRV7_NASVI|nr:dual specificity protein kinase shkC-like [Nasonia vitripennis]